MPTSESQIPTVSMSYCITVQLRMRHMIRLEVLEVGTCMTRYTERQGFNGQVSSLRLYIHIGFKHDARIVLYDSTQSN